MCVYHVCVPSYFIISALIIKYDGYNALGIFCSSYSWLFFCLFIIHMRLITNEYTNVDHKITGFFSSKSVYTYTFLNRYRNMFIIIIIMHMAFGFQSIIKK